MLVYMLSHKKITRVYHTATRWLIRVVQIQLFVTIVSLPILTNWGIPTSWFTLIGNIIFTPFLSGFLLLSSLVVITALCSIPNMILVKLLDLITTSWLWLLGNSYKSWLVALPQPPWWWCFLVLTGAVMCVKYATSRIRSVILLSGLLFGSCSYLKLAHISETVLRTIPCSRGYVTLIRAHETTWLIDPGHSARLNDPINWIDYTLLPTIIKTTGSMNIDHYIIMRPTVRTLKALHHLIGQATIHHLYIPFWEKQPANSKTLSRTFMRLKHLCEQEHTKIHRLKSNPATIFVTIMPSVLLNKPCVDTALATHYAAHYLDMPKKRGEKYATTQDSISYRT